MEPIPKLVQKLANTSIVASTQSGLDSWGISNVRFRKKQTLAVSFVFKHMDTFHGCQ